MSLRDKLGICQWFHYEAYHDLDAVLEALADLDCKHFRTGISWADYMRPGGKAWYDHQMSLLRDSGMEVLLSLWHTPPSISVANACSSPPRCLKDFADFVDVVISDYGDSFSALELWNEPNNRLKWNFPEHDPQWEKFGAMVGGAAYWARQRGIQTVLGGMVPVDGEWLKLMQNYDALRHMDVIAIHGFPGMWWPDRPNWDWHSHWNGWAEKVAVVEQVEPGKPVWITETGLATWDFARGRVGKHDLQIQMLEEAAAAPAERVYWYSVMDLHPDRDAIEGFHVDENEYHLGLVDYKGQPKPTYNAFKQLLTQASLVAPGPHNFRISK